MLKKGVLLVKIVLKRGGQRVREILFSILLLYECGLSVHL